VKVLFIHTAKDAVDERLSRYEEMQFGISYISSWLKAHGHSTRLLYLCGRYRPEQIDHCIQEFGPGLICFTAVYSEYRFVAGIASYIKGRFPALYLLAGGAQVTLDRENCLADPFDALCIGEGEGPTLELVQQLEAGLEPSGIQNLWIKRRDGVERNPCRPFIADLDSYPFPDRDMWREWIGDTGTRQVLFMGRGCPFPCTYCSNHALRKVAGGTYVRYRAPERIVAELAEIRRLFPSTREVYLEVESFSVNMEWALSVCRAVEEFNSTDSSKSYGSPMSYGVNLRLTTNNRFEELFPAMKRANFRFINIGLESGSERVRREVLKRNYSNEDVVKAVRMGHEFGLQVSMYVLIGVPGETPDDFIETVRVLREARPDFCGDGIFFPYPGTELYDRAKAEGLLPEKLDMTMERRRSSLDMPYFRRNEILRCYFLFDHYVYKGVRPWYKIYPRVLNKIIYATPVLYALTNNRFAGWLRKSLRGLLRPSNQ
jgi:anaerobic magnesium-protoporphyrin IX monomethyl ester cyclase